MRVLMRMGMSPFDNLDLYSVISRNAIGTNAGNMLFPYAIIKNIYEDDIEIDAYKSANEKDADKINETYDMFLIPLTNAFREDFVEELRNLTKLVQKLKIPCVVIGVGLQAAYEPDFTISNSFDEDVLQFCNAVLEKSRSIGVRGEITQEYLVRLGIKRRKIDVIGCPSMYTFGDFLPLKKPLNLSSATRISFSYNQSRNEAFYDFFERIKKKYPDYCYILQSLNEMKLLYAGDTVPGIDKYNKYYIGTADSRSFLEGRMRMFINVPSWIDFLTKMDLGVGCCIHGSIASVLAGNPTIAFAFDSRVRALAEYHNIPVTSGEDIKDDTELLDIYESIDFAQVLKGHVERYDNFKRFLKKNGISCADVSGYGKVSEFDRRMSTIILNCPEGVVPYRNLPAEEQDIQLKNYLKMCDGKINWCHKEKATGNNQKRIDNILVQWENSKKCCENNINKLR